MRKKAKILFNKATVKMGIECVKRYTDIVINECLEKYPEIVIAKCLEKYPELVGKLFLKHIAEYLKIGDLKSVFCKALKECLADEEINRKSIEFLFEINASKEPTDFMVKKLVYEIKNNNFLFYKLFHRMEGDFPQFYSRLSELVPGFSKSILMEIGTLSDIFLGGTGKAEYNEISHKLVVQGYYLPAENFDEIVVYSQEEELGHAELGVKRPDIYKKVPNYHNLYSGWYFSAVIDKQPDEIEILVKRGHKVVKKEIKTVDIYPAELAKLQSPYMIEELIFNDLGDLQLARINKFNGISKRLSEYFDWGREENLQKFLEKKEEIVYGSRKVEEIFLDIFCENDNKIINFADAQIEFQDSSRLWTSVNRLLVQEECFFKSRNECPFIIDGKSDIGLAVYYFKRKFPKSRVVAFEPSEEVFAIAKRNIEKNGWKNVELLPFAPEEIETVESCINDYIISEVDFLKLDVKGVMRIIKKLYDKLKLINHIFLEGHFGELDEDDSLEELLRILGKYGFQYQVMKYGGQKYTLNILGRRNL